MTPNTQNIPWLKRCLRVLLTGGFALSMVAGCDTVPPPRDEPVAAPAPTAPARVAPRAELPRPPREAEGRKGSGSRADERTVRGLGRAADAPMPGNGMRAPKAAPVAPSLKSKRKRRKKKASGGSLEAVMIDE